MGPRVQVRGEAAAAVRQRGCRPRGSPEAQRLDEVEGDRAVYEYLLDYAPRHLGAIGADIRGVHLLRKDGRSQMGLT